MKQYIDKADVVAEIERLKEDALQKKDQCKRSGLERIMHKIGAYNKILSFLNTLEVKEVDLETELNIWRHDHFYGRRDKEASGEYLKRGSQLDLAKYFFELGLKVKKENKL